jgi:hypothetical protein
VATEGSLWRYRTGAKHVWVLDSIIHDDRGGPAKYWMNLKERDLSAPFDGMGKGFRISTSLEDLKTNWVEQEMTQKQRMSLREPVVGRVVLTSIQAEARKVGL